MPSRNQSGKKSHHLQNPSRSRPKSGRKIKNTIDSYIILLRKEQKEGLTKWIINTKQMFQVKFKKFGITNQMINKSLTQKNLTISTISTISNILL